MIVTFADSFFYLALLNADDQAHERAVALSERRRGRIVTTAWVLTEVADAFCGVHDRQYFIRLIGSLRSDPNAEIVSPDQQLFERGIDLFSRRPDKEWSLTD